MSKRHPKLANYLLALGATEMRVVDMNASNCTSPMVVTQWGVRDSMRLLYTIEYSDGRSFDILGSLSPDNLSIDKLFKKANKYLYPDE